MFGMTTTRPRLDYWPEATTVTESDIIVAGISLRRLAEVCGTPSVHSAATVIPGSGQTPTDDASTGVLVTHVLALAEHRSGAPVIQLDARLDNLRLVWSEARLIGAPSGARSRMTLLVRKPGTTDIEQTVDVLVVDLPAQVEVGDLVAIPSRSLATGSGYPANPVTGRRDGRPSPVFAESGPVRANRWEAIE
jgi:hypothetical protein